MMNILKRCSKIKASQSWPMRQLSGIRQEFFFFFFFLCTSKNKGYASQPLLFEHRQIPPGGFLRD